MMHESIMLIYLGRVSALRPAKNADKRQAAYRLAPQKSSDNFFSGNFFSGAFFNSHLFICFSQAYAPLETNLSSLSKIPLIPRMLGHLVPTRSNSLSLN